MLVTGDLLARVSGAPPPVRGANTQTRSPFNDMGEDVFLGHLVDSVVRSWAACKGLPASLEGRESARYASGPVLLTLGGPELYVDVDDSLLGDALATCIGAPDDRILSYHLRGKGSWRVNGSDAERMLCRPPPVGGKFT
jgi:hypothetical protein